MPITGQYTWEQDVNTLQLKIPLKGTKPALVDIYATEFLVKINFAPHLVHIDLFAGVDDNSGTARVKNGVLTLKIDKRNPGLWDDIAATGDKKTLKERRIKSVDDKTRREQELIEKRREKRTETERTQLRKQMGLEETERNAIENLKAEEKEQAEEQVYATFAKIKREEAEAAAKQQAKKDEVALAELKAALGPMADDHIDFDDIDVDSDEEVAEDKSSGSEDDDMPGLENGMEEMPVEEEEEDLDFIPDPRASSKLNFKFTPRLFPTPLRESKRTEEGDWISKNRSHLKTHPHFMNNKAVMEKLDGDITERDPTWLKGKGDDFYRSQDYLSAINAYSTALEVAPTMSNVLSNRAACYLCLGKLQECIDDTSDAMSHLPNEKDVAPYPSEMAAWQKLKIRLYVRRGTAQCQRGSYEKGLSDYNTAMVMSPDDQSIQYDVKRITILCRCNELKADGDKHFAAQELDRAVAAYSEALELDGGFVSCVSNRATCYLAMGNAAKCIEDCTQALDLLRVRANPNAMLPTGPVPAVGSTKRRQWVLKTLVRRGTAHSSLSKFAAAVEDFRDAVKLDPENEGLKADLAQLEEATAADAEEASGDLD